MRWIVTLTLVLFGSLSAAHAQFFDHLTNPTLSVRLKHPAGLGLKISKIAFGPTSGQCSGQIVGALIDDFVSNRIEVIDRENLDAILAEHDFSLSGYVDQTSAAAIGKIIGPSAIIFVKTHRCTTQQDRFYDTETRYDKQTKRKYSVRVFYSRTRAFLKASIQTVDLATGRIFAAQSLDYSPEQQNKSYQGYPEAPAGFDVLDGAIRLAVRDVHRMFLPWSERTELVYYNNKACGLQQAFQALKAGDVDRAFDLSRQNLETCKSTPKVKDKVLGHAYYNVGMSYMTRDEYDRALEYFRQAARLRPGNIVTQAMADCQKAKRLMLAMQRIDERAVFQAEKRQVEGERAAQVETANTLTNADVIKMVQQKLPDSIIVQKIVSSKSKFDTSPDSLIALTDAGVSAEVMLAMMEP